MEFERAYWTVGPYDMVAIFTAANDGPISAHLLEIASSGCVRTTTLRPSGEGEMWGILQRLG